MAATTQPTSNRVTYLPELSNVPSDTQTTLTPDMTSSFDVGSSTITASSFNVHKGNFTILPLPGNCRVVTTEFTYIPWANPSNIISLETTLLIVQLLGGVLVPVVAFLGLVLNVLNGLVFYKQGLRERINLLLFSQAVFDFAVEVEMLFQHVEYFYTTLAGNFTVYGPVQTFKQNHFGNFLLGFVYVSGFVTTLIACERWLCVSHPFTAKKFLKTKVAAIIVVTAAVVLVGGIYIVGDKYRIGCLHYLHINLTVKGYIPSAFYLRHRALVDVLNGVVYGLVLPCVFVTTTTITTAITAVQLRSAAAWRQQSSSGSGSQKMQEKHELAVTKTLILVSCLFVICTLPNIAVRVVPVFVGDFSLGGRYQNAYLSSVVVVFATPCINSCLNFFFYLRMGSRFRTTLKKLWCCGCRGPKRASETTDNMIVTTVTSL